MPLESDDGSAPAMTGMLQRESNVDLHGTRPTAMNDSHLQVVTEITLLNRELCARIPE